MKRICCINSWEVLILYSQTNANLNKQLHCFSVYKYAEELELRTEVQTDKRERETEREHGN